jgi:hypothetical protein
VLEVGLIGEDVSALERCARLALIETTRDDDPQGDCKGMTVSEDAEVWCRFVGFESR